MISALSTAVSGLDNAYQRFDISANKIASGEAAPAVVNGTSSNTPFVEQTGHPTNTPTDINNTAIRSVTPANTAEGTQGDTARQLINANIASYDAQGNIAVIKTANKTFQALINIVG